MAWRSSGNTNGEMVSSLKRFQVISSLEVEEGFRNVDRKLFVPKNYKNLAYKDQPIKEDNVHISAPHIYGSVLEAFELRKGAGLSVLHAGSGTGYMTCIMASILGPHSVHYCVEIHQDVMEHAKQAIGLWKETCSPAQKNENVNLIHGNALELDTAKGECVLGFDRIYIGAAVTKRNLPMFKSMLKQGGILVGPVEDELVKVIRIQTPSPNDEKEYTLQVLSGVRFAPLVKKPNLKTVIPARVWSPTDHQAYPDSFRKACKQILLCSRKSTQEREEDKLEAGKPINAASLLPRALWMEVLSFTHRDWFEPPINEVEFLRKRLREEQALAERANRARLEAESRCHLAEKERDVYRILARRWKARLNETRGVNGDDSDESIEEAAAAMLLGGREPLAAFGLGHLFRRFRARAEAAAQADDEEEEDEDELEEDDDDSSAMEEDDLDVDEDDVAMEDGGDLDQNDVVEATTTGSSATRSLHQARTVSIAEEDF